LDFNEIWYVDAKAPNAVRQPKVKDWCINFQHGARLLRKQKVFLSQPWIEAEKLQIGLHDNNAVLYA